MASYVALADFKKYANKREEDATGEALYQTYIDSAEQIVKDYLAYDPASQVYTHTLPGSGLTYLQLKAKPVTVLTSVTADGTARNVADFRLEDERLYDKTRAIFSTASEIVVVYTAGWVAVPGIIKLAVMRIASLLSQEAGENIGVTSTSFDGGNSRTFINYTNFAKYLAPLSSFRVVRL
jgi:hypothetical protein